MFNFQGSFYVHSVITLKTLQTPCFFNPRAIIDHILCVDNFFYVVFTPFYRVFNSRWDNIKHTVKPSACNVGLVVTYQLSKGSLKTRHLTNSDIGQGRSIVDTMSCNLLMRRPFDDEFLGESNALNAFRKDGKNNKTTIPIKIEKDKHYMLTFIAKNRFGSTDEYTIVSECDLSTNEYQDVGYCIVPGEYN